MGALVPSAVGLEVPFFALSRINQYAIEERWTRGGAAVLVFGDRSAGIRIRPDPPPATSVAPSPDFAAASAFEDRYARYLPRIYRYLYARCGNAEDAADLAQQVFLQTLTARHPYREGSVRGTVCGGSTTHWSASVRRQIPSARHTSIRDPCGQSQVRLPST